LVVGVVFADDEVKGDLEKVVAFGVKFEFLFDLFDLVLVGRSGSVEVHELVY